MKKQKDGKKFKGRHNRWLKGGGKGKTANYKNNGIIANEKKTKIYAIEGFVFGEARFINPCRNAKKVKGQREAAR